MLTVGKSSGIALPGSAFIEAESICCLSVLRLLWLRKSESNDCCPAAMARGVAQGMNGKKRPRVQRESSNHMCYTRRV